MYLILRYLSQNTMDNQKIIRIILLGVLVFMIFDVLIQSSRMRRDRRRRRFINRKQGRYMNNQQNVVPTGYSKDWDYQHV